MRGEREGGEARQRERDAPCSTAFLLVALAARTAVLVLSLQNQPSLRVSRSGPSLLAYLRPTRNAEIEMRRRVNTARARTHTHTEREREREREEGDVPLVSDAGHAPSSWVVVPAHELEHPGPKERGLPENDNTYITKQSE